MLSSGRYPTPSFRWTWQYRKVRSRAFNFRQRAVVIVGFGAGLFFFGSWLTTRGGRQGWVAYAPLSNTVNASYPPGVGLQPWVRLLIWLALVVVWVVVGVILLRSRRAADPSVPDD